MAIRSSVLLLALLAFKCDGHRATALDASLDHAEYQALDASPDHAEYQEDSPTGLLQVVGSEEAGTGFAPLAKIVSTFGAVKKGINGVQKGAEFAKTYGKTIGLVLGGGIGLSYVLTVAQIAHILVDLCWPAEPTDPWMQVQMNVQKVLDHRLNEDKFDRLSKRLKRYLEQFARCSEQVQASDGASDMEGEVPACLHRLELHMNLERDEWLSTDKHMMTTLLIPFATTDMTVRQLLSFGAARKAAGEPQNKMAAAEYAAREHQNKMAAAEYAGHVLVGLEEAWRNMACSTVRLHRQGGIRSTAWSFVLLKLQGLKDKMTNDSFEVDEVECGQASTVAKDFIAGQDFSDLQSDWEIDIAKNQEWLKTCYPTVVSKLAEEFHEFWGRFGAFADELAEQAGCGVDVVNEEVEDFLTIGDGDSQGLVKFSTCDWREADKREKTSSFFFKSKDDLDKQRDLPPMPPPKWLQRREKVLTCLIEKYPDVDFVTHQSKEKVLESLERVGASSSKSLDEPVGL